VGRRANRGGAQMIKKLPKTKAKFNSSDFCSKVFIVFAKFLIILCLQITISFFTKKEKNFKKDGVNKNLKGL